VMWDITLHNGRYSLAEVLQYARYLFLEGASLSDILLLSNYGRCFVMGGAPLWDLSLYEVPLYRGCSFIEGAFLLEGPRYESCPFMEGATLWQVLLHGRWPFMGDVP